MKRTFSILFALVLVLGLSLVAATTIMAQSWLTGWSHRVEITIDSGKIDQALVDFPVLLYLSASSGINGTNVSFVFDELGTEKLKLAVTKDDGITQCYVEIEKWDSANRQAWLWVKVPNIASGANTTLYLYYDHTQPDNTARVGETGTTPAQNVWDSAFVGVWHKADGPAQAILDSTSHVNHGTKKAANQPQQVDGQIGKAQDYDGIDDVVTLPIINLHSAHTIECWFVRYGTQYGLFIGQRGAGGNAFQFYDRPSATDNKLHYWNGTSIVDSNSDVSTGTWHYAVATHDGANALVFYLNGVTDGSRTLSLGGQSTEHIVLQQNTIPNYAKGLLDEVRFSSVARSAAWIKATYHSGDDSLLSYGSEELATQCVTTATGTGTACFTSNCGAISNLTSVSEASLPATGKPNLAFPHGFFSFNITGCEAVNVTITLPPGAAPTQYWKYHVPEGWIQIPMTVVGPSNVIRITLVDGGLGDDDGTKNGVIVDQGAPGSPGVGAVGWETYPINKVRVLLPWIALGAAIIAGVSLLVLRRRRAQS